MGNSVEQADKIEAASEHAALSGTRSVNLLRWNNAATVITCLVGICALLTYFFGFAGEWRGVKDDVGTLKQSQSHMEKDLNDRGVKIDQMHDDVQRLIDHAGLHRSDIHARPFDN